MSRRRGWFKWSGWVAANAAGFAIGSLAAFPLSAFWRTTPWLPVTGLAVGVAQGLVLRRLAALPSIWWIVATAAGSEIGILVGWRLGFRLLRTSFVMLVLKRFVDPSPEHFPAGVDLFFGPALVLVRAAGGAAGGAVLGLFQWAVLRHERRRAGQWILASILGFGLAVPLTWDMWLPILGVGNDVVKGAAMGAAAAAVTGLALPAIRQRE